MTAARAGSGWWPYLSSFALHGVLVVLIASGWFHFRTPSPPEPLQLAIEATVVTDLPTASPLPAAPPEPAAPVAEPAPPEPDPLELQRQAEAEQKAKAEQKAAEARQAEQRRVEAVAAEAERRKQREAERKAQAQAEAQKKAEADKKAQLARQKADEERKQKAEEDKRKQAELQKQAEKVALEREQAELRERMAAEERVTAARSGAQAAQYKALIRARIERAWIRPPTARAGLDCEVRVTQVPGGAVTAVKIDRCNGDAAVRESIEAAVYRASPLPVPENPDLFERNLVFNFRPND